MNNEELDSQLSAMFDNELPATECELLARRLARDEQLRTRWGRYAAIGACIRGEPGVRLETTLVSKVSAAIKQETIALEARGHRRPQTGLFQSLGDARWPASVRPPPWQPWRFFGCVHKAPRLLRRPAPRAPQP